MSDKKEELKVCGECEEPIFDSQPSCIYDGEYCHIDCASEAEDEAFFDRDLMD